MNKNLHDATCFMYPSFNDDHNENMEENVNPNKNINVMPVEKITKTQTQGKICPYCNKEFFDNKFFLTHVLKHEEEFNKPKEKNQV